MKGYATGNSPYARKARMAVIETGQPDLIEWQMISREERAEMIPAINPLGKVPVVVLNSGEALFDSPVICACIDAHSDGAKIIPTGDDRWRALTLEALGDGLGEAVIATSQEDDKPDGKRSQGIVDRQLGKVKSALAALDAQAKNFRDPITVGEIAVACSLGYMEFRDVVPGWRETYANLGAWYTAMHDRPSFKETMPS